MIQRNQTMKFYLARILILTSCLFTGLNTHAFSDSRSEKWEFFLAPQFTNSKVLQFNNGAEADINEHSGLGFGMGYNLNHHVELALLFAAGNSNYTGTRILDDGSNTEQKFISNLYTSSIDFSATYNFSKKAFTPWVSASIGSTYIDSGIPTGDIDTFCWWDPWLWTYICAPTARTYTTTEFHYSAGAGLRYDFNRQFYIKGGVNQKYIDLHTSNTPDFTTWQIIFGLMF